MRRLVPVRSGLETFTKVWNEFEFETEEDMRKFWANLEWTQEDDEVMKTLVDNLMESEYTRELIQVH